LRLLCRPSPFRSVAIALTILGLLCVHWRHGLHLHTGAREIDDFVANPPPRIDFSASSSAIDFVRQQPGLFRTVGFGAVLFPGVNGMFGLESIYGPDPLANPYYHELLTAAGVRQEWSWRWIVEKTNPAPRPLYDMLNVRCFLDTPQPVRPEMAAVETRRLDLDVAQNQGAWPRAFFVESLGHYDRVEQFVEMLHQQKSHPFAAEQTSGENVAATTSSAAIPAQDYRLTTNTTTFTIDAPAAGIAVLTEAFVADDFRVTLNGAPAEYFRVNHAFRGVRIPAAGRHVVSYSYWPRYFTLSLVMAAIGFMVLAGWSVVTFRRTRVEPATTLA
jgi:hypothetical protein